jgi:hypothetical protein
MPTRTLQCCELFGGGGGGGTGLALQYMRKGKEGEYLHELKDLF